MKIMDLVKLWIQLDAAKRFRLGALPILVNHPESRHPEMDFRKRVVQFKSLANCPLCFGPSLLGRHNPPGRTETIKAVQAAVPKGIVRIDLNCSMKVLPAHLELLRVSLPPVKSPFQIELICLDARCVVLGQPCLVGLA